jgi:hypothetical protein
LTGARHVMYLFSPFTNNRKQFFRKTVKEFSAEPAERSVHGTRDRVFGP